MIAALFPGQGSHAIGMGTELAQAYPVAQQAFDVAAQVLPELPALMREGPLDQLTLTANQQPALVTASLAAFWAWREVTGVQPAYAAGHSLGEFSAHVAAGSLELADALALVNRRGQYMQEAVAAGVGAMAAIMGDPEVVQEVCNETAGVVEVANFNAPTQTVISGEAEAVAAAGVTLKSRGCKVIPLKVSAPFHCSLMEPARVQLAPELTAIAWKTPAFPVVANVTAQPVHEASVIAGLLSQQVTGSVRWVECMLELHALGVTEFVEFGSGNVLTGLLKRILPDATCYNIRHPQDIQLYLEAHA